MRIFISYSHQQGDWVWRLLPCLQAAGADFTRPAALSAWPGGSRPDGRAARPGGAALAGALAGLFGQRLLPARNAARFAPGPPSQGLVLPVTRVDAPLPRPFNDGNPPLYAKLQDDSRADAWDALLRACQAGDLGCAAPDWLQARDDAQRFLQRGQSVNLVTYGKANWRGLLDHLAQDHFPAMARVDLEDAATTSRRGLLAAIATALGERAPLPPEPHDLAGFARLLQNRPASLLALSHFDLAPYRADYDMDLYAALRDLLMEKRKLALLVQSHTAFAALLPAGPPLSDISAINTVELRGQP